MLISATQAKQTVKSKSKCNQSSSTQKILDIKKLQHEIMIGWDEDKIFHSCPEWIQLLKQNSQHAAYCDILTVTTHKARTSHIPYYRYWYQR